MRNYIWYDTPEIFTNGKFRLKMKGCDEIVDFRPLTLANIQYSHDNIGKYQLVARPVSDLTLMELDKAAQIYGHSSFLAFKEESKRKGHEQQMQSQMYDRHSDILVWNLQQKENYRFIRLCLDGGVYPFNTDSKNVYYLSR